MFKPFFRRKQNTLESKEELNGNTNNIPKARENADDQVVISIRLHLIGLKSGASFLDQSLSEVKQNQFNLDYLRSSIDNIFGSILGETVSKVFDLPTRTSAWQNNYQTITVGRKVHHNYGFSISFQLYRTYLGLFLEQEEFFTVFFRHIF